MLINIRSHLLTLFTFVTQVETKQQYSEHITGHKLYVL